MDGDGTEENPIGKIVANGYRGGLKVEVGRQPVVSVAVTGVEFVEVVRSHEFVW